MLFAAYRALPRLSVPRHPPCALLRLTGLCVDAPRLYARVPHFLTEPLTINTLQVLAYTLSPNPICQRDNSKLVSVRSTTTERKFGSRGLSRTPKNALLAAPERR